MVDNIEQDVFLEICSAEINIGEEFGLLGVEGENPEVENEGKECLVHFADKWFGVGD